ncbi:MAG: transglycosylase SLT domain-containing protein [Actinobacteria bacterium]|nr:transglycosylase SLT domain-containing protein [Actinomycetota bacterium]
MKKFALTVIAATSFGLAGSLVAAAPASAVSPSAEVTTRIAPKPQVRVAVVPASISTKPSRWRGRTLVHPNGSSFPRKVSRWANLVRAVMKEHRIKRMRLSGILAQIQQESGGRKNAINNWDSNARRGTPSMGLLQMIAPTYTYYAKRGLKSVKYQRVPYANLWSAMNYVKSRYGMGKFKSWSKGYNQGY